MATVSKSNLCMLFCLITIIIFIKIYDIPWLLNFDSYREPVLISTDVNSKFMITRNLNHGSVRNEEL